jgi:hypothetical protein
MKLFNHDERYRLIEIDAVCLPSRNIRQFVLYEFSKFFCFCSKDAMHGIHDSAMGHNNVFPHFSL